MPEDRIKELVAETLAAVGLKDFEDLMPSELSGGMKKGVALARSIINGTTNNAIKPEVLLYDEPTDGIASSVVEDLIWFVPSKGECTWETWKDYANVAVTHQHITVRRAVERLVFMRERLYWKDYS